MTTKPRFRGLLPRPLALTGVVLGVALLLIGVPAVVVAIIVRTVPDFRPSALPIDNSMPALVFDLITAVSGVVMVALALKLERKCREVDQLQAELGGPSTRPEDHS